MRTRAWFISLKEARWWPSHHFIIGRAPCAKGGSRRRWGVHGLMDWFSCPRSRAIPAFQNVGLLNQ